MEKFTASEVRERKRFEEWYATHSFNYSRDPIGSRDCSLQWEAWKAARADLLEAQEKAVPVAWMHFYRKNGGGTRMWFPTLVPKAEPQDGYEWVETRPLQENTHPAPADADRLAEALRNLVEASHYADAPDEHEAAEAALAAHSAQAQPKNVSFVRETWTEDADGDRPNLCTICGKPLRYGTRHTACAIAQSQPPAASVTDAVFPSHRACVPYENHPGKRIVGFVIDESHPWWGKCGLTEPLSALEAALAAQENPNG